jgi:tRNA-dihydrouridine synthase B
VAVEMSQRAQEAGAAAVTIHPVPGRGERRLDWSLIGEVKRAVNIPVIGNGGVRTPQDAERMFAETGCDALMVGRAALGNPWIFEQIAHYLRTGETLPAPDLGERLALAMRHGRLLVEQIGEERATREMRKHLGWYLRGFRGAARVRGRINEIRAWGEVEALLESLEGRVKARQ